MYEPKNPRLVRVHKFLVEAAETERRLPSISRRSIKTLWPEVASEQFLDYRPTKTPLTLCGATNKQIDAYSRALDLVVDHLDNPEDRCLVWAVVHSAAFRTRGPAWLQVSKLMHTHRDTVRARYENALLDIVAHRLSSTLTKNNFGSA